MENNEGLGEGQRGILSELRPVLNEQLLGKLEAQFRSDFQAHFDQVALANIVIDLEEVLNDLKKLQRTGGNKDTNGLADV